MNEPAHRLRTVNVIRYATPLREGGSLPAIVEADDDFMYVIKFRGAGQGPKALIAELIGGEIARLLGLRVPEIVFANLDEAFGRTEPDEEIQDLLRASEGLNLALHYLAGAITYDSLITTVDAKLASEIVWLDCFLTNVDRTDKNTNMLMWHKELWLIDHGAALYFHHTWDNWKKQAVKPFMQAKDHVLLPQAADLEAVDDAFRQILTPKHVREIVALIPDSWL
ncbi:MAG: HipA family kinase, partial [Bacteroidia bacterium]